ncbi:polyhydroxyalkanoic acid system protein [Caulobacter sp. Root487D2Y]|uniref:polyhydroxyalkanoic acid system family protein n=1 Tax=Caulobacter sp. Root487D2Y TaxID=1736547 RepID=UPI0006F9B5BD|nr:polyhydroxyalkanoic acid system family protein [Caulobacter sp. Root487D2Y]KQY31092.1 polyhydroxyalkanoic acid system protein [Caulobacter sp. Root487D2Y]
MSKPITITLPHQLGLAEARRRIDEGFGQLLSQTGGMVKDVQKSWTGDALTFSAQAMGQPISGVLTVFEDSVRMDVVLPGLLGVIAGKITGQVKKQGQLLLEKK